MELNSIIVKILRILISEQGKVSVSKIMDFVGINRRVFLYNLKKLNEDLDECGFQQITMNRDELILDVTEAGKITRRLLKCDHIDNNYILSTAERKNIVLLTIGISNQTMTLEQMAELLCVSKNTVLNTIPMVKEELKHYGIVISNRTKGGYFLSGDECSIRCCLYEHILQAETQHMKVYIDTILLSSLTDGYNRKESRREAFMQIYDILQQIEVTYKLSINHNAISDIVYYILLIICRNKLNAVCRTISCEKDTDEYEIAKSIINLLREKNYSIDSAEVEYLTTVLLGAKRFLYRELAGRTNSEMMRFVDDLIDSFEMMACINFRDRDALKEKILIHASSLYYRLKYNLIVENKYTKDIKSNYPDVYYFTELSMKNIEKMYGFQVPETEIAYLSIYYVSWMDRRGISRRDYQGAVLIVCGAGIGTSILVRQQLVQIIGDSYYIETTDSNHLAEADIDTYDLVLTTVKLPYNNEKIMPVLTLLSEDNKNQILKWYINHTKHNQNSQLEDLLAIISESAVITDRSKMAMSLRKYLESDKREQRNVEITDLISQDMVQIFESAMDAKDALFLSSVPLQSKGLITGSYVEAILDGIQKNGMYSEIFPGVLFAHAFPGNSVSGVGMSITWFSRPTAFEMGEVEPIKIIFMLCTPNNKEHRNLMKGCWKIFTDKVFLEELKKEYFENVQDLYDRIKIKIDDVDMLT